tara:strand:+ start:1623 stop:2303 length:681 start_codon:yes stop_codon:yes gene_type:complete
MADLRIGSILPPVGDIKVGSQSVDRIYAGDTRIFPNYACTLGDVTIGTQTFMGCNLDVDTYRNGDPIPEVQTTSWNSLTTGAWCYYANATANGVIYGKLYNWYAVNDSRGLAPVGYHVPTFAEITTLANYLGGYTVAGGKVKQAGTVLWQSPNSATNTSGFTAIPGGYRSQAAGGFNSLLTFAGFWTSTAGASTGAMRWACTNSQGSIGYSAVDENIGSSVRLIKD